MGQNLLATINYLCGRKRLNFQCDLVSESLGPLVMDFFGVVHIKWFFKVQGSSETLFKIMGLRKTMSFRCTAGVLQSLLELQAKNPCPLSSRGGGCQQTRPQVLWSWQHKAPPLSSQPHHQHLPQLSFATSDTFKQETSLTRNFLRIFQELQFK